MLQGLHPPKPRTTFWLCPSSVRVSIFTVTATTILAPPTASTHSERKFLFDTSGARPPKRTILLFDTSSARPLTEKAQEKTLLTHQLIQTAIKLEVLAGYLTVVVMDDEVKAAADRLGIAAAVNEEICRRAVEITEARSDNISPSSENSRRLLLHTTHTNIGAG